MVNAVSAPVISNDKCQLLLVSVCSFLGFCDTVFLLHLWSFYSSVVSRNIEIYSTDNLAGAYFIPGNISYHFLALGMYIAVNKIKLLSSWSYTLGWEIIKINIADDG